MDNEVQKYIDSVIPKNIPKSRQSSISDELESHIYEKIDFYEEIGYSKEQSIKKALEEMGEDEEVKQSICDEFDELYHEKTWWAFAVGAGILLINFICGIIGLWVSGIDYMGDPILPQATASVVLILIIFGIILFAVKKRYVNVLIGIAVSNFIIGISILWCFYPQCAIWSAYYNLCYLLDKFTPLFAIDYFDIAESVCFFGSIIFVIAISVFCIFLAINIEEMKDKTIKNIRKGIGFVFAALCVATCILHPLSTEYKDNYKKWFFEYNVCISAESTAIYNELNETESYDDAVGILKSADYTNYEEFEKTLEKAILKQIRANMNHFTLFDDSYEIWFNPEKDIYGNGFVFIKKDQEGNLTGYGIGNGFTMYTTNSSGDYDFRIYETQSVRKDDMQKSMKMFKNLKIGDKEEDVMNFFGKEQGVKYTIFTEKNDGKISHYYRICCCNYDLYEAYYLELTFEDGILTNGNLYDLNYGDYENVLKTVSV
ncbi:MAG: permease prefix domain 1-containing protein [Acutalibacteraceae bacterium]